MAENGGSLKLFTQFVKARPRRPKRLILDIDATDVPLHGEQEGRRFHGYYDHYCYLPLYVFCGRYLLVASLRRSDADAARRGTAQLGDPGAVRGTARRRRGALRRHRQEAAAVRFDVLRRENLGPRAATRTSPMPVPTASA